MRTVEHKLILQNAKTLVEFENSGCVFMFQNERIEDLKAMYELFAWVPEAQRELRMALSSYVKQVGKQIVVDEELLDKPTQFVDELLNLRHKFDRVIAKSFNQDNTFQRALKEAFEEFVNVDTRVASFLALYVDSLLKSGMKGMTETDVEHKLDRIVVIFRHLSDKDIFEQYYQQHLAKRLLQGKSISEETERLMITKLRTECGFHFTQKLEGMFQDLTVSNQLMSEFKDKFTDDLNVSRE
jgi:cullin 3